MPDWLDPFTGNALPIAERSDAVIMEFMLAHRPFFIFIKQPVDYLLVGLERLLTTTPPLVVLMVAVVIAWQVAGRKRAIATGVLLICLGFLGERMWQNAMTTVSIVLSALLLCLLVGLPSASALA